MSAAPKQSTKKTKTPADFLKERPSDKSEQISGKEILKAATLKNDTTRKVVGFLLLVLSVVFFISLDTKLVEQNLKPPAQWAQLAPVWPSSLCTMGLG